MTWSANEDHEVHRLLIDCYPNERTGTNPETWKAWSQSLARWFRPGDVMAGIVRVAETDARFPSLARLREAAAAVAEERRREHEHEPRRVQQTNMLTVEERLASFDTQAKRTRAALHAEFDTYAAAYPHAANAERATEFDVLVDAVGPFEAKARELLERGIEPGRAAIAMMSLFTEPD